MDSILNKAIMKRTLLWNKFLKTRSSEPKKTNNKRNFYLNLVKKVKWERYSAVELKNVIDRRKF